MGTFLEELKVDLFQAYYDARRHKRNTHNQLKFEINYESNLLRLYDDIVSKTYELRKSICFIVNKPLKREIFAADFRDRIVHHLLFNYINPCVDQQFIEDSYSCRKGRGNLFGIRRAEEFMRSCSEGYTQDCYILKLDVRGYFMSIDKQLLHEKLFRLLRPMTHRPMLSDDDRLKNDYITWLLDKVIWNDPIEGCIMKGKPSERIGLPASKSLFHSPKGAGLPIGNLTSQLFSNVYLHDLDYYVKHELQLEYYGRYVDDFFVIHHDKNELLKTKEKIRAFMRENCRLDIHPNKIYLQHYAKGFLFLGAYIKPGRSYVGRRVKAHFLQALYEWEKHLQSGASVSPRELEKMRATINSYLGIMKHHSAYNVKKKALFSGKIPAIHQRGYFVTQIHRYVLKENQEN